MSMPMLTYVKNASWPQDVLEMQVKDFIENLRSAIQMDGVCHMILEPGDGTRYEFGLIDLPNYDYMVIYSLVDGWSCKVGRPPRTVPWYIQEKIRFKTHSHTLGLVCDILNRFSGNKDMRFYNWEKGRPMEVKA